MSHGMNDDRDGATGSAGHSAGSSVESDAGYGTAGSPTNSPTAAQQRVAHPILWPVVAAAVLLLDLVSKSLIAQALSYGQRIPVLPFFDLTLLYNTGAAFSFLSSAGGWQRWFFIALALAVGAFIVVLLVRSSSKSRMLTVSLALILGGALGNVHDRIVHGHVVDFLLLYYDRWHWPAFNVADSAITVGAVLLVLDEFLRARRDKGGKENHGDDQKKTKGTQSGM